MRRQTWSSAAWAAALFFACGCETQTFRPEASRPSTDSAQTVTPVSTPRGPETIRVASFNIQVFGQSKMDKPHVVRILAEIIRQYDVVAIQEVRAKDQTVLSRFVHEVNATGAHYDYVLGERLGRTSSKEQYAFIYDTTRLEVDQRFVGTMPDPQDLLHREPMTARFVVRGPPSDQAFTFLLVNIHTDPDEVATELNALDDYFAAAQRNGQEDDVILLGDLNVDERRLGELGQLPGIAWVISGQPTNTRGDATYDNIVFDRLATLEYTGYAGVLDVQREFGLTLEQALEVSDHLPVWAEFSAVEQHSGGGFARRSGASSR